MKKVRLFIVCLVMAVLLASTSPAAVIGSYTIVFDPQSYETEGLPWMACLWFSYHPGALQNNAVLFNGQDTGNIFLSLEPGIDIPSNIGKTFWAASDQDDPEYSLVVSMLTSEEQVFGWLSNTCGWGYPIWWSDVVGESSDRKNLHDYTIERVGLRIDSAECTLDPPSGRYIYSTTLTAIFEGYPTVPEPSSLLILISGIGGLCGACRRRKKRTL